MGAQCLGHSLQASACQGSLRSPLAGTQACALKLSPPPTAASAGGYLPHRSPNWPTVAVWSLILHNDFCFPPLVTVFELRLAKRLARYLHSWQENIHYSKGQTLMHMATMRNRPQQYMTRAWLQCCCNSCQARLLMRLWVYGSYQQAEEMGEVFFALELWEQINRMVIREVQL